MTRQVPEQIVITNPHPMLLVAFELSSKTWKLAIGDRSARKGRVCAVDAWDFKSLARELKRARHHFGLPDDCPVLVCMEAGRDGFSVHRALQTVLQVESIIVDPASIEVSRRRRRRKTDRLDALKLLARLRTYVGGDEGVWAVLRIPTIEQEDARRQTRERARLVEERKRHSARIRSLLATVGLRLDRHLPKQLESARTPFGTQIPPHLREEIGREYQRLTLVKQQLRELEKQLDSALKEPQTEADRMSANLRAINGIGLVSATVLVREFFGWRRFNNRRQVGGAAGLTGTPFASGQTEREQGIDKAGNRRVRVLAVEIAWCWLRYQPQSKLSRWYFQRFDDGTGRSKRKGIVALARRLLIELWRYVTLGVVPEGATLRALPQ